MVLRPKLYVILFLFLFLSSCSDNAKIGTKPKVENGILDLRNWDFRTQGSFNLDGTWEFYWKEHFSGSQDITIAEDKKQFIKVPSSWNGYKVGEEVLGGTGFATYRTRLLCEENCKNLALQIMTIGTAGKLIVNNNQIASFGTVGMDSDTSVPAYEPKIIRLESSEKELNILIQVSNFDYAKGGLWRGITIGDEDSIRRSYSNSINLDLFLFGGILIMSLYHLGLYSLRKKDGSSIYFAWFGIAIGIRVVCTHNYYITNVIPSFPWDWIIRMEYIGYYMATLASAYFVRSLFPGEFNKKVLNVLTIIVSLFAGMVLLTETKFFTGYLVYFQMISLFYFVYLFYVLGLAVYRKHSGARTFIFAALVFIFSAINDIARSHNLYNTIELTPYGMFAFLFFQAYILSARFSRAFLMVESLSANLQKTNSIYEKFVPTNFLQYLGKENITDIDLGNQSSREMTIMFTDIRNFTQISERMNPKENFDFINTYFNEMGPIVRNHNGFIDKYIGDAIMALFGGKPENGLDAAIEMVKKLDSLNLKFQESNLPTINIGIGIHTGNLMLGIVGESERFNSTVISDSVNLASRIEGLNKMYTSNILISEQAFNEIQDKSKYNYRIVGKVRVKGKDNFILLYEIFDGSPQEMLEIKNKTKKQFEEALEFYQSGDFANAEKLFHTILQEKIPDETARYYLEKCQEYAKNGLPENWDGVETLTHK